MHCDAFADREQVRYRFRGSNRDGPMVVEQQAYLTSVTAWSAGCASCARVNGPWSDRSMGVVRYLAPDTDAYVASVQRHAREFEAQSGHRLEIRILGSDEYFSNRIGSRLSGDDAADVFMSGPVLLWEHVGAGLVEPLDEHLAEVDGGVRPRRLPAAAARGQPLDRTAGRPARHRTAAGGPRQLRVLQPRLRAADPGRARARRAADVGGLLRRGARGRRRARREGPRVRAARPRRVAHDVHGVRDAVVELRRARLRSRRARGVRRPGRGRATADFVDALRDAGPSTGPTSAGTSWRWTSAAAATPCSSTPTTTSPSSRTSATPSWSGASATRCPRRARPANGGRTCGHGRWR